MDWYLWVKALHIIGIIAFMAGMLYLPRLFVYHASAPADSAQSETFKLMERRLLKIILNPALVAVWLTGIWLAVYGDFFHSGWLHAKIIFVLILTGLHVFFAASVRRFAHGQNRRSDRFYRIINEVPTVAMIMIVILVTVKPF